MGPCDRAQLRTMQGRRMRGFALHQTHLRILAAYIARALRRMPPSEKKRAQGRPGARCTRGLVCNCAQKTRTRAYRFSGNTPAFPAQWLYSLLRALPGERLFCHRRRANLARLDASTAASGPHDFAVRFTPPSSVMASASTATCPNVRDDGQRPSEWDRMAPILQLICPTG